MRFNETDAAMHNQMDFVPRERRMDVWKVIIAFVATVFLIIISVYSPLFKGMESFGPLLAILAIIILCLFVVYRKQVNLDLVMSTEYQNMIFAQALTQGYSFTFIVQRDGSLVYTSEGLSDIFPDFSHSQSRSLAGIFEHHAIRQTDRERIMGAIHSGSGEHLIFPIIDKKNEKKDYIITVEPIQRPSGFSIIRGREYLGKRTGSQMMPDILSSTTIDKLDRLLSTTPTAMYTTDTYGRLEYVNPALEHILGYEPGQILELKLSIQHIVFSMGSHVLTEESSLVDYAGSATIVQNHGVQRQHTLVQYVTRDSNGKVVGATGSIFPISVG